jgi:hypothetical protein
VRANQEWRKQYVRFEADIAQHSLKVDECAENVDEVFISVITKSPKHNELVIELAKKNFGKAYAGLIDG